MAAVNRAGAMRRVFPVPFRLLEGRQQFKKWEWIRASMSRPTDDLRPESYRIDLDTVSRTGDKVGTENGWRERRKWIEPHVVEGFEALEARRQSTGETLGFIRPGRLLALDIKPVKDEDWSATDKAKLLRDGLFDPTVARGRPPLRKLPYDFYYEYECETKGGIEKLRHKITDWEAGALYWHCRHDYGAKWERYFQQKLEEEFSEKDLLFLMGTIHRFPDMWLIVGLAYPPKRMGPSASQLSLGMSS